MIVVAVIDSHDKLLRVLLDALIVALGYLDEKHGHTAAQDLPLELRIGFLV